MFSIEMSAVVCKLRGRGRDRSRSGRDPQTRPPLNRQTGFGIPTAIPQGDG